MDPTTSCPTCNKPPRQGQFINNCDYCGRAVCFNSGCSSTFVRPTGEISSMGYAKNGVFRLCWECLRPDE